MNDRLNDRLNSRSNEASLLQRAFRNTPSQMGTIGMLVLLAVAWYGLLSGGCSAPTSSRCNQDVCEVTINRTCTADEDCCCAQACTQGVCKPKASGETVKTEDPGEGTKSEPTTDGAPPVDDPPVDTPPSDDPPVDNPPTDDPPADDPPVDNPPVDIPGGPCTGDETRPCYGGPDGTEGKGPCKAGTQRCENGQWGPCVGQVLPSKEVCDGKDNNCDGKIDETTPNVGQDCTAGQGECQATGKYVCKADGSDTECNATPGRPRDEACGDGKDNDCDGMIDETCKCKDGDTQACYTGSAGCVSSANGYSCKAPCKAGTQTCRGGNWGDCQGQITATKELCDGKDNDCDGNVDEDFSDKNGACKGSGPCGGTGVYVCKADGSGLECNAQQTQPQQERCNGKDDDCDGRVDENWTRKGQSCSEGTGGCRNTGKYICNASGTGTICNVTAKAAKLETCNGIDDDCDGRTDEGLARDCFPANSSGTSSKANVGVCRAGLQECSNGRWGSCQGAIVPSSSDSCGSNGSGDGADNDCDGQVDEGCRCRSGERRSCGTSRGSCRQGTMSCGNNGRWGSCQGGVGPTVELCNNRDDDCDGRTDENFPAKGRSCSVGQGDCRRTGQQICTSDGKGLRCSATAGSPRRETCDGRDNDCNGLVDEGCP